MLQRTANWAGEALFQPGGQQAGLLIQKGPVHLPPLLVQLFGLLPSLLIAQLILLSLLFQLPGCLTVLGQVFQLLGLVLLALSQRSVFFHLGFCAGQPLQGLLILLQRLPGLLLLLHSLLQRLLFLLKLSGLLLLLEIQLLQTVVLGQTVQ